LEIDPAFKNILSGTTGNTSTNHLGGLPRKAKKDSTFHLSIMDLRQFTRVLENSTSVGFATKISLIDKNYTFWSREQFLVLISRVRAG